MAEEIVAIIPARGGSKGIPRKNVLPLAEKPLIAHTIEAASRAKSINRLLVSTDDAEIEFVAREYGAEVIQRPAEISGDAASSESALLHALEYLKDTEDYEPDIVVFLQCTSPLTASADVDGTVEALKSDASDSALAVVPFHYFLWKKNSEGDAVGINHDKSIRQMRQERAPQYLETGAVYVMRTKGFLKARHRFFGKTTFYVMPPERRLEIDELVDFKIAEALIRKTQPRTDQNNLAEKARGIKLFVSDVDGVLTDAGMYYTENGDELKKFNTRDGMGFALLRDAGIKTALVTSEDTRIVERRAKKMGVDFLRQGVRDKLTCVKELAEEVGIGLDEVCFVGDDINDGPLLRKVGLACCPANAFPENRKTSHYLASLRGGEGCVREVVDKLLGWIKDVDSKLETVEPAE